MKKILFAVFMLMSFISYSQSTGYLRYDSVRIQRGGGNSTLIIENATRNVTGGFLQNYGEGRTKFARALDSVWVDGDSLRFRYGSTTIAVSAPGGGPDFGFFNDETSEQPSTTKTAIGNYTLTGVDTLTLGFNTLYIPNIESVEVAENAEFLIRSTTTGQILAFDANSLLFGLGDNLFNEDRGVDLNGNDFRIYDGSGVEWAPDYFFRPDKVTFSYLRDSSFAQFFMSPLGAFMTLSKGDSTSGLAIQGVNQDHVNMLLLATGQISMTTDSLKLTGIGEATDTTSFKPLVMDEDGYIKRASAWFGGGGVFDNIYTANGTLAGNRTVAGGNNSLTFNGLSSFIFRSNGASVDQIYGDGSGTSIWEPFGTAYVALSDQQIDIDADNVYFPQLAGVGDRYTGVNSAGKKIIMPTPSGSIDTTSLSNRIDSAFYEITAINDSTIGMVRPNGLIDSIVIRGIVPPDPTVSYVIAASDETTDITTGDAKVTFRIPHAMTVTEVRASLTTASSSGNPAIRIKESGVTILSTNITIDSGEKTSESAATPPVISDVSLSDDAEITIDVVTSGTGAKGLKVIITGTK